MKHAFRQTKRERTARRGDRPAARACDDYGLQLAKPQTAHAGSPALGRWAVLALSVVLVAGATWAVFEFVVYSKIPTQLVGKWVIEGGEQDGATLDFFRNGTMVGNMNVRGDLAIVNARVAVDGNKLFITTRNPNTKLDETRTQIIKVLTDRELLLESEQGKLFRLSRAE